MRSDKITQREAALVYADCIDKVTSAWTVPEVFWPIFNRGIAEMWPSSSGLEAVKAKAWKEWARRHQPPYRRSDESRADR